MDANMKLLKKPQGEADLVLQVQRGAIEHLGVKLYQRPADVISELVANAWDADATAVDIDIDDRNRIITVSDNGLGMTYRESQSCYLQMGRNRRIEEHSDESPSGRPLLGRKGIGKFSGFGIARKITVETVSCATREMTIFSLELSGSEKMGSASLDDLISYQEWRPPSDEHVPGTIIRLEEIAKPLDDAKIDRLRTSMSRRFLLADNVSELEFKVLVNGKSLDTPFQEEREFDFPRELTMEERVSLGVSEIRDEWAVSLVGNHEVLWKIGFMRTPIKDDELRGIAIFARGKLAQKPFFFEQTGGSSADFARDYITGQMIMDFIDEDLDLISPERQRVYLEDEEGAPLKEWGLSLLTKLNNIWKKRRGAKRVEAVIDIDAGEESRQIAERINALTGTEQKIVRSALENIAEGMAKTDDPIFLSVAGDLVTAYEKGRLTRLIEEIGNADTFDQEKMLEVVVETGALSDLQIGEAIKTRIEAIAKLNEMIENWTAENTVRDYISEHPWIIKPQFQSFARERKLMGIISDTCDGSFFDADDVYSGRVDLLLANATQKDFLLLEFMRPGKKLDQDHIRRIDRYVFDIREHFEKSDTREDREKNLSEAWVVAEYSNDAYIFKLIEDIRKNSNIHFVTWASLLDSCLLEHEESLKILKERSEDPRILAL